MGRHERLARAEKEVRDERPSRSEIAILYALPDGRMQHAETGRAYTEAEWDRLQEERHYAPVILIAPE